MNKLSLSFWVFVGFAMGAVNIWIAEPLNLVAGAMNFTAVGILWGRWLEQ